MAEGIITRRGGSKPTQPFALIQQPYPVGSTCTCSKGDIVLTAPDTSGLALFVIPEAGTWTITTTDGTDSKAQTVKVSTQGETIVAPALAYELVLLSGTDQCTSVTGGWEGAAASCEYAEGYSTPGVGYSSSGATLSFPKGQEYIMGSALVTRKKIDLTSYKTLSWTYSGNDMARVAVASSYPSGTFSATAKANATANALNVSSLKGEYYVVVCASNGWGSVQGGTINNIKLKP